MSRYREEVILRQPRTLDQKEGLKLAAMGLSGEVGEVIDILKKFAFHDKPIDRDHMVEELGDVRWYFEYLLHKLDITMEEVEETNIQKLRKRFPDGFTKEAARVRADKV